MLKEGAKMKILICEDDFASRKFLVTFLSKYHDCDNSKDGYEAFNKYTKAIEDKKPYEVIFLDIMLPKVDGIKVLKSIRDIEKKNKNILKCKIIITSALYDEKTVKECYDAGCDEFLSKPLKIEKIKSIVNNT